MTAAGPSGCQVAVVAVDCGMASSALACRAARGLAPRVRSNDRCARKRFAWAARGGRLRSFFTRVDASGPDACEVSNTGAMIRESKPKNNRIERQQIREVLDSAQAKDRAPTGMPAFLGNRAKDPRVTSMVFRALLFTHDPENMRKETHNLRQ